MGGVVKAVFGGGGDNGASQRAADAAAQAQAINQQQAAITNQQGQQLKILTQTQAKNDEESAGLSTPQIGRALLAYRGGANNNTGAAGTLGG